MNVGRITFSDSTPIFTERDFQMSASMKNIAILAALVLVAVLAWRRYGSRLSSVIPG